MKRFINTVAPGFGILAGVMGQTTNAKDAGRKRVACTPRERRPIVHPQAGFTGVELLIIISIVLILTEFAIPNLIEARKGSNEVAAIGAMRTLSTSQTLYRSSPSGGDTIFTSGLRVCLSCMSVTYNSSARLPDGTEMNFQLQATPGGTDRPDLLRVTGVEKDSTGAVTGLVVDFNPGGINQLVQAEYANTVPPTIITLAHASVFGSFFGGSTTSATAPPGLVF